MPTHARRADVTLSRAEEVESRAAMLAARVRRFMADGEVSLAEAHEIRADAEQLAEDARDVVKAAEETSIAELVAASVLTGRINAHVRERAEHAGVEIPVIPFPEPEHPEAA